MEFEFDTIWVRSRRCGCLVTWFCYRLIAKPGNKTAAPSWPDPYIWNQWNKANLRDLIAVTGLVVISNWIQIVDFSPLVTLKFDGWHRKNNRAFLLYYVKLYASFQIHQWIQTGVTVRNPSNGVEIEILSHVTFKFDGWPWKTIWHLFFFFDFSRNFEKKQGKSEGFESCDRPIVQKRLIWVKISDILSRVTLKFDGWPWKQ